MLTKISLAEEVKGVVFALTLANFLARMDSQIFSFNPIGTSLMVTMLQLFNNFLIFGKILVSLNLNFMFLIPKIPKASKIVQYCPIVLGNFLYKTITKIISDHLAIMASKIITPNQFGFLQGSHIEDCILSVYFANILGKKCYGGNVTMKIDIKKAFDSMRWNFILRVLSEFQFSIQFCTWIWNIFESAKILILINGTLEGYFNCSRASRQGDPLSLLLFGSVEEFLSHYLALMVSRNELCPMSSPRGSVAPTHLLYANDVLFFCRGTFSNLKNITNTLNLYTDLSGFSGQCVNWDKFFIYFGTTISH